MDIRLESIKIVDDAKGLMMSFDIYLPNADFTFRGWKLRGGQKGVFVAPPAYLLEEGGEKKWIPFVEIGMKFKKAFFEKVKTLAQDAYNEGKLAMKSNPEKEPLADQKVVDSWECPF